MGKGELCAYTIAARGCGAHPRFIVPLNLLLSTSLRCHERLGVLHPE